MKSCGDKVGSHSPLCHRRNSVPICKQLMQIAFDKTNEHWRETNICTETLFAAALVRFHILRYMK